MGELKKARTRISEASAALSPTDACDLELAVRRALSRIKELEGSNANWEQSTKEIGLRWSKAEDDKREAIQEVERLTRALNYAQMWEKRWKTRAEEAGWLKGGKDTDNETL